MQIRPLSHGKLLTESDSRARLLLLQQRDRVGMPAWSRQRQVGCCLPFHKGRQQTC